LIYAIVPEWYMASTALAYGLFWAVILWVVYGPVVILFYGLPLGFLYEGTQQPVKPEDTRKHKPIAGVVAGFVGALVVAVLTFIQLIMEMPDLVQLFNTPPLITNVVAINFILIFFWGIIFNIIFVLLYARMPGKNVMKGLYYGLILFLVVVIYNSTAVSLVYSNKPGAFEALLMLTISFGLAFISYGIVLGYFYKK